MTLYYDFGEYGYEYEVENERIDDAVREILSDKDKNELIDIIIENIGSEFYYDWFENELTEYFYEDAQEMYEDSELSDYKYNGVKESDF